MDPMKDGPALGWIFGLAALATLGCANLPMPFTSPLPDFTEEELREELVIFASRFTAELGTASEAIRAKTRDPQILRNTLLWRMRLVPAIQEAASVPDPQEAYASALYATALQRRFFTTGDGSQSFGPYTPIAAQTAILLEEECYSIAGKFLSEEDVERLRRDVEGFIATRSISTGDFSVPALRRTAREAKESGIFTWLIDLPMSPFRALQGVGSGAAAMHDLNDTALRFAIIVEGLPEQVRWQTDLLLYDLESRGPLEEALGALDSFAESAQRLTRSVERLPDDLTLVLSETRDPLVEVNRALLSMRELMDPLSETANQINLAGASWAELVRGDGDDENDASSGEPGRPFDIREYEATARSISDAANQLQALVAELGTVLGAPGLQTALSQVDSSVARAEAGSRGVVDHAAWRVVQLLLVFFALLLGYRWVTSRPTRVS